MSVLVYTANFGARDNVRPQTPQIRDDVDWLCITDSDEPAPIPWVTMTHAARHDPVPNLAAKWWRTHPPFDGVPGASLTRHAPYDYAIWIDANMQVTARHFVSQAIAAINDGIAVWKHPRRSCVVDEMEASLGAEGQGGRYDHLPMREQVQSYLDEGYPLHNGLYATGTLVWTPETAAAIAQEWYDECCKWGYQDQVSFPVVCWRHGIKPGVFPVDQTRGRYNKRAGWWNNAWMMLHDHRPGTG